MMACPAAITDVRRMLQPRHQRGHPGHEIAPITACAAFDRINWWTLATIEDAFVALVVTGEADPTQVPGGGVGYHISTGRARDRK